MEYRVCVRAAFGGDWCVGRPLELFDGRGSPDQPTAMGTAHMLAKEFPGHRVTIEMRPEGKMWRHCELVTRGDGS